MFFGKSYTKNSVTLHKKQKQYMKFVAYKKDSVTLLILWNTIHEVGILEHQWQQVEQHRRY